MSLPACVIVLLVFAVGCSTALPAGDPRPSPRPVASATAPSTKPDGPSTRGAPASATRADYLPIKIDQPGNLKDVYAGDFLIGAALDFRTPDYFGDAELAIIKSQYNALTPENSMKPQSIQPAEGQWDWTIADRLVEFGQANNIAIFGHTLVWHQQTPKWFFTANGKPVDRDLAIQRLRTHIHTLVGRYKGKIKGWDVVNEAISDGGGDGENLRDTPWLKAIGPDYIALAFKFAREADPAAELYYNDYNIESGAKHQASLRLLKRLIAEGTPITGVGIQGHWSMNNLPYAQTDQAIQNYHALGLKVMITELDIGLTGPGGGQLNPASGPATTRPPSTTQASTTTRSATGPTASAPARRDAVPRPPTPEQLQAQAQAYAKFFGIFRKHNDKVTRVTFWGLSDARSWRARASPLLYDRDNNPKPAYYLLTGQPIPATQPTTAPKVNTGH